MNALSHEYCNLLPEDLGSTMGNLWPDAFKYSGQKVDSHSIDRLCNIKTNDPLMRKIMAGMLNHIIFDARFHNSEYFKNKVSHVKGIITKNDGVIPSPETFSHVLVELMIDVYLHEKHPELAGRIHNAFDKIQLIPALEEVSPHYGFNPQTVGQAINKFLSDGCLTSYINPEAMFSTVSHFFDVVMNTNLTPYKEPCLRIIELSYPLMEDFPLLFQEIKP